METRIYFLNTISEILTKRLGIVISKDKRDIFLQTLLSKSKQLNNKPDYNYLTKLENSQVYKSKEWFEVIEALNIAETFFFRDSSQMQLLVKEVLPEIIKKNSFTKTISIFSAGCSTGEEPYSIAMLIKNLFHELDDWNIKIIGSDINEESIEKARKGIYSEWSMRNIENSYLEKFFKKNVSSFELTSDIRSKVSFRIENLLSISYQNEFDLIVCRNVFIYLSEESKKIILDNFSNSLKENSYLMLGHSEVGNYIPSTLDPIVFNNLLVYKKIKNKAILASEKKAEKISLNNLHFPKDDFEEKLNKARFLANAGKFFEAKEVCESILKVNQSNHELFFLVGQILEAENRYEESIQSYQKSIQLEPKFLEAYLSLASLYNVLGKESESKSIRLKGTSILKENSNLRNEYEKKGFEIKSLESFLKDESGIWI
ncbi:MAG: CheR family methyltransferase [Leptospiraceae bacterium]|nr:CheR family methyltransferase [Leptospiraceae bacterium]